MDAAEIDQLRRELASLSLYAETNRELLKQIQKQVEALLSNPKAELFKELTSINAILKSRLSADFDFDLMKVHFEEVHPEFYAKLSNHCPDLTHKESRLAAFVKMRLTNKEIAFLLNITHNGVKKAIQRLRKKIGLGADDSLRKFLDQL